MTEPSADRTQSRRAFALAMLAFASVAAFLYVKSGDREEKKPPNPACEAAQQRATSLKALAKGEMRGFVAARASEPMTALAFNGPDAAPTTLDRLQQKAGSDAFEVVAVNVDTSRLDRPKAFLGEIGVKALKFYADPKGDLFFHLKQSDGMLGLPTTFLIDASGCQLGSLTGPAIWDSAEAQALVAKAAEKTP